MSSTVTCSEKNCIYQSDGFCKLDTATKSDILYENEKCVYYRENNTSHNSLDSSFAYSSSHEEETNSDSQEQNRRKP